MVFLAGALLLLLASDFIYSYLSIDGAANDTLQTCMGALSWILVAWAGYERLRNKDDEGSENELTLPLGMLTAVTFGVVPALSNAMDHGVARPGPVPML